MAELIQINKLTVELPTAVGGVKPVSEISLQIAAGESLGLVGESGSGKTILSLALMGLLPPGARVSGEIWWQGGETSTEELNAETQRTPSKEDAKPSNLVEMTEAGWPACADAKSP